MGKIKPFSFCLKKVEFNNGSGDMSPKKELEKMEFHLDEVVDVIL